MLFGKNLLRSYNFANHGPFQNQIATTDPPTRNMFKHKCGGASTEAEKRAEKGRGRSKGGINQTTVTELDTP